MKQLDLFRSALIFTGLSLAALSISAGIGGGYGGKEEYEDPQEDVQGNALEVALNDTTIDCADVLGTLEDGSTLGFYLGAYYYENHDGWWDYYTVYDTSYRVSYSYSDTIVYDTVDYYIEDEIRPIYSDEIYKDSIIRFDTIHHAGDPITRPYHTQVITDSIMDTYVDYQYDYDSIVPTITGYYKEDEIYTYKDFDPEDSSKFVLVYDTIHLAGDPIIEDYYLVIDSIVTTYVVDYIYSDTTVDEIVGYYKDDTVIPIYYEFNEDSIYVVRYDTIHLAGDPIVRTYYTEIITDSIVEPYVDWHEERVWIDTVFSGWYIESYEAYFCGAISQATDLTVPDSIYFNGRRFPVCYSGRRNSSQGVLDFTNATSVTSLTLPATIYSIYTLLPSTITDVHFQGENPPSIEYYSNNFFNNATVWVPQSAYQAYKNKVEWGYEGWYNATIIYEGWAPITCTINIETAGTLMDSLNAVTVDWSAFDTLYITGNLNEEDLYTINQLSNIKKLDMSGTVTDFSNIYGFSYKTKLETVVLPITVNSIGSYAFQGCSSLKNINLDYINNISDYAFAGCLSLTQLDLSSAYYLGNSAFNMGDRYSDGYYDDYGNIVSPALTSVILSDNLTDIPNYCFAGCNLTSINFPSSLQRIGYQALDSIKFDSIAIPEGVSSIDYGNFLNAKVITLPSTISFSKYGGDDIGGDKLTDIYLNQDTPQRNVLCSNRANQLTLHVPYFSVSSYSNSGYGWSNYASIVPMEGNLGLLTVSDYLELTDPQKGFAEKAELDLLKGGHLTINSTSALSLGAFIQEQSTSVNSYYDWDDNDNRVYFGGVSTLIADNAIEADSIVLKLQVRTQQWNFISFPFDVNVSDIEFPEGTLWVIRKYSGAERAAQTGNSAWQNMPNGTTLNAGEGYILHCATENYKEFVEFTFRPANSDSKDNIFAYQDVVKPLNKYDSEFAHNRSWNLVGNPYPAFYDISSIEHNGVITVYNGGYDNFYGGNSYTAYNPQDDDYMLLPNQAFFVQCPDNASSMTFKADGRTHDYEYYHDGNGKWAPVRSTAAKSGRLVLNFTLANADFTDRTRLVINPDAKADYEISCDASKFMSDDASLQQIYIVDGGIRYAIDERPLGEGKFRLGMRFGKSGIYTIQMSAKSETDLTITLTDTETGQKVNLKENSYSFSAQSGTSDNRFILTLEGEGDTTKVFQATESVNDSPIYDINGRLIPSTQKGINIINQDGNYQKILK